MIFKVSVYVLFIYLFVLFLLMILHEVFTLGLMIFVIFIYILFVHTHTILLVKISYLDKLLNSLMYWGHLIQSLLNLSL